MRASFPTGPGTALIETLTLACSGLADPKLEAEGHFVLLIFDGF